VSARVVIFGREPLPGKVKTRLARDVGTVAAARVYAAILEHTLTVARATGMPVVLALADPPTDAWVRPEGVWVEPQGDGDLGARMLSAFERHLAWSVHEASTASCDIGALATNTHEDSRLAAEAGIVVLVGSDSPCVDTAGLLAAARAARCSGVALGPATDGGYWVVAQRAPGVDLFSGVPWSVPETLAATRARLAELGVDHTELDARPDVDTAEDLRRVLASAAVAPELARRLRRSLARGRA
jgi:glycosyltransferase A (GT-A) superfamily protein (DUF2064 family)